MVDPKHEMYSDPAVAAGIEKLLTFDALAAAERKTGQSYKTDSLTAAIGFLAHLENSATRNAVLAAVDDSQLSNRLVEYARILEEEGFRIALDLPFAGAGGVAESFQVWWHSDGLFLRLDTYGGDAVNSASVYYNWRPNPDIDRWRFTSSGCMHGDLWVGDHDAREAIRFKLFGLRSNGAFLSPWRHQPHLWLCHYAETRQAPSVWPESGEYYDRIRDKRIALLPADVQSAIAGRLQEPPQG